jgi:leucyl-tRNA synthetase
MQAMGLAIDWSREVATCDPSYYKWNQWLFLKMLEKGIAYRKTQVVNWDPVDQTVLANEQVIDGKGWRTGAVVEKREIPGYYLKITDYAQELLDHVQVGGEKPPRLARARALMQENWIGKSEGVRFAFTHDIRGDAAGALIGDGKHVRLHHARRHHHGRDLLRRGARAPAGRARRASNPALAAFIEECKQGGTTEAELALKEKEGMPTGLFVTHPLTGAHRSVGGQLRADELRRRRRDGRARARRARLRLRPEVRPADPAGGARRRRQAALRLPTLAGLVRRQAARRDVNSGSFRRPGYQEAVNAVAHALPPRAWARKKTTWRLRDWGMSRQRYWGTPIPIIHCAELRRRARAREGPARGAAAGLRARRQRQPAEQVKASTQGVVCPAAASPRGARPTPWTPSWIRPGTSCATATRPTPGHGGRRHADYWMPMDQYIGGIEHAILHLLYARFWTKVMRDLGLVKVDEPFTKLLTQGMVLNHIYSRKSARAASSTSGRTTSSTCWTTSGKGDRRQAEKGRRRWPLARRHEITTRAWAPCPSPRTTVSTRRT